MSYCEKCQCASCEKVRAERKDIFDRLKEFQDKIAEEEKNRPTPDTWPWYPKDPWTPPVYPLPNARCPKCGIALGPVMMYCCPDAACPTGLGPRVTCGLTLTTLLCKS